MSTPNATEISMTPTEQKLLASAWQCFEGMPNIDFDKLARIMGHTNFRTTKNMMGAIRKKLTAADDTTIIPFISPKKGDESTDPSTPTKAKAKPKTKTTPKKRSAGIASDEDVSDDATVSGTDPVKTTPKKASPKKRVKKEVKKEVKTEVDA